MHQPRDVRIYLKEARFLAASGFRVAMATTVDRRFVENGIDFIPLGSAAGSWFLRLKRNVLALQAILRRPRCIVHFHDPELMLTSLIPLLFGWRIVYDVHEFYAERIRESVWISRPLRGIASKIYSLLERLLLPFYAGIVVVTPEMQRLYTTFLPESKVVLVRNYPAIDGTAIDAAAHSPRPIEQRYVLHTGGASFTRAFHVMVAAAEELRHKLPDSVVVNCGRWDLRGYSDDEQAELLRRAEAANIRLLRHLSYGELLTWIAHAHVCCAPRADLENERRSLSVKVFEYFAFGKPVVVSTGLSGDIVRAAKAGFCVASDDPTALANGIVTLFEDESLYAQMSTAALKASSRFSFEPEFDRLLRFYESLFSSGSRSDASAE